MFMIWLAFKPISATLDGSFWSAFSVPEINFIFKEMGATAGQCDATECPGVTNTLYTEFHCCLDQGQCMYLTKHHHSPGIS